MNDKDKSFFVKLVLAVIVFVSFFIVFGVVAQFVKNKRVISPRLQVSTSPEPTNIVESEIKTGKFEINLQEMSNIEKLVDQGSQPWRLNPIMVLRSEMTQYGFDEKDYETLANIPSLEDQKNFGIKIFNVQIEITHKDKTYVVTLVQPVYGKGYLKIWTISEINLKDKDVATGWQTCENDKYGYEIKYPLDWKVWLPGAPEARLANCGENLSLIAFSPNIYIYPDQQQINIDVYDKNRLKGTIWEGINSLDDYLKKTPVKIKKETIIDGKRLIWRDTTDNQLIAFYNGSLYYFSFYNIDDSILDKFLKTFKFIEKDETADWKTYRNEKYGFQLKYPENFSFEIVYGHVGPGVPGGEYENTAVAIHFIVSTINPIYPRPILTILVYTKKQWEEFGFKYYQDLSQTEKETVLLGENRELTFISDNVARNQQTPSDFISKVLIIDQIVSTFKFTEKDETAGWQTYKSDQYGFEVKYPNAYTQSSECSKNPVATCLVDLKHLDIDATISIRFMNKNFNLQDIKRQFAPTGNENPPEQVIAGQNIFYFYGAGGGGVSYPDNYFYNLNGKIIIISFDGPYIGDKTPSQETKDLEPKILSTFKFLN